VGPGEHYANIGYSELCIALWDAGFVRVTVRQGDGDLYAVGERSALRDMTLYQ
jgi:hypothetical protein